MSRSGIAQLCHVLARSVPSAVRPVSIIAKSGANSMVPKVVKVSSTPRRRPRSPMRLTTNAFCPAATASGFL